MVDRVAIAEEAGKYLFKIDQWFASSKTCSTCGELRDDMPLHIRKWACKNCHANHDRDVNAANNIKYQGLKMLMAAGLSVSAY